MERVNLFYCYTCSPTAGFIMKAFSYFKQFLDINIIIYVPCLHYRLAVQELVDTELMDKKYTEDEAKVSACNILPFYSLKLYF